VSEKTSPTFLAITRESIDGFFIIFGRNVTEKASNHNVAIFFPPHLINASTLPCETENMEIVSFSLNAACLFASRHISHIEIIT